MATAPGPGGLIKLKLESNDSSFTSARVKYGDLILNPSTAPDNTIEIPVHTDIRIEFESLPDDISVTLLPGSFLTGEGAVRLFNMWDTPQIGTWTGLGNLDTTGITSLRLTFATCKPKRASLYGLENWDTSSVTDMDFAFSNTELTSPPIGDWDVSSVTTMKQCFYQVKATGLDLSRWNTSKLENLTQCFYRMDASTNINVSNWDTSSVDTISECFANNNDALSFPGIETWKLVNCTNMHRVFKSNYKLNQDISGWTPCSATRMDYMFNGCNAFTKDISSWQVPNIRSKPSSFDSSSGFANQTHLQPQWGEECTDTSTTIGNITITGTTPVCKDELVGDYVATYDGDAQNVTYAWASSDGGAQFTDADKASTKVVFSTAGNHTVSCVLSDPDATDTGASESFSVVVEDCSTTIGTVTITGPQQVCTGDEVGDYTANYSGDAVDVTYQWTGNATFTAPTSDTTKATFNSEGNITISCTLTSSESNDSPQVETYTVTSAVCVVDPCDGVTCGPNEYCDNGVCKPTDPCEGVTCGPNEICVNGICEPDPSYNPCDGVVCPDGETCINGVCQPTGGGGGGGADEFHYRYPNHYFTSRQDTLITTRDTQELNDYEKGIGRTETVDRTLDKKIILPPDFNP